MGKPLGNALSPRLGAHRECTPHLNRSGVRFELCYMPHTRGSLLLRRTLRGSGRYMKGTVFCRRRSAVQRSDATADLIEFCQGWPANPVRQSLNSPILRVSRLAMTLLGRERS